ncbi:bis(5'-nucleosyl)-tetraphosphatase (symmetrical) YqeK [Desulfuribacillus alkaliarsenatis]|uniref:bis(5'-nucleosyl)-tetraphosphatase (symmetrical) n=1 Tax=Desulfuribacillus alkaliarsenatis TaxID=766136 RepID=A0A1E5G0A0_9FIRM|nr:bis(5'-nucleosyl)-tetraphosphatase (symmetrical) YqeK [Desulfuribacillus alkaliarsenatis]OEF96256.1 hypothetical protein BHF68_08825 [Desulfuribacillus alkaliarsenatis]
MDICKEWITDEKWEQLLSEVSKALSFQRFEHTKRVIVVAKDLAKHYNQSIEKVMLAALFHDYAKELPKEKMRNILTDHGRKDILAMAPAIWHAPVGAYLVQSYPFGKEIFDAVCYHTTGRKMMSDIEKIIFLADYIEPSRSFPGVEEVRNMTWKNLDEAMYLALNLNIEKLLKKHFLIAEITVDARNYFLTKRSAT